jgi:hypothetical protein
MKVSRERWWKEIYTGTNGTTRSETHLITTLSTNLTWNDPASNPGQRLAAG